MRGCKRHALSRPRGRGCKAPVSGTAGMQHTSVCRLALVASGDGKEPLRFTGRIPLLIRAAVSAGGAMVTVSIHSRA